MDRNITDLSIRGRNRPRRNQPEQQIRPPIPRRVPRPLSEMAQLSKEINALDAECRTVPIGRITYRQQTTNIEKANIPYYRSPRPLSSLGTTGKQGTFGQPVNLLANYFPFTSYTNWCLYQYRVDFNPEEDTIGIKRSLVNQHQERLGGYLFDGSTLFSGTKYDPEIFELTSQRRSDDKMVILKVKFTNIIETGDYANIQVFNLLLRNCLRHLDLKLIGRNFYDPKAKMNIPQHRLELWPGYETSIRRYEDGILLCAEISTKVMRQETVLDFFHQFSIGHKKNNDWMIDFKAGIIGAVVLTAYNNETYRIDDIDENSDPTSTFEKNDGSKISYTQYYKERWNLCVRGGKQPMLISKNKKSKRGFGDNSLVYLVPEFCFMTGINDAMRHNFNLMKDIAIYTRVSPEERTNKLISFARRLQTSNKSMDELKKWNLTLSNDLVSIRGRVLPMEQIKSTVRTYNGGCEADWTKNLRDLPMYVCALPSVWCILAPKDCCSAITPFVNNLISAAKGMSFKLPQPTIVPMQNGYSNTYLRHLEMVINDKNPSLILCILPSARGDLYNLIKRKLCVNRAVPSQVVLLKNVQKNNLSVCTKIAIQLNCKLGGAPWLITIPKKGMMIVGFDVCHDNQRKNISYGALVATMNDTHTSYFSCVEPHESGEELSNHFAASISKALLKYQLKNGSLPTSIVVYRDGVGEGQISHVHKVEVKLLKHACNSFYGANSVPMAFIIVTKRISTRFFAPSRYGAQNPQPGTIVDSVVTDPTKYDFFLVSQHVRQGTVTPTHYQIIEDTLNLPPDIIQRLTFKLTHMYYNWSGTVRVPAPCQLAHKLAFLTAQTLNTSPNVGLDELLYFL